jgi:hypothetical protein
MTSLEAILRAAAMRAAEHLDHPKLWMAAGWSAEQIDLDGLRLSSVTAEVTYVVTGVELEMLK